MTRRRTKPAPNQRRPHSGSALLRSSQTGFSLVELVLVLSIIATFAAIALPRYSQAMVNYRVDLAAARVQADLELARRHAMATEQPVTVVFDAQASTIASAQLAGLDDEAQAWLTDLSKAPYEVTIVSASFDSQSEVTFDAFGVPDNGGVVTVQAGSVAMQVKVDGVNGEVRR